MGAQYGLVFEQEVLQALKDLQAVVDAREDWDHDKKNDLVLFGYRATPRFERFVAFQLTFQTGNALKMAAFLRTRRLNHPKMVSAYVELPAEADPLEVASALLRFAHEAQTRAPPFVVGLQIEKDGNYTTFDLNERMEAIKTSIKQRAHLRRRGRIIQAGPTYVVIRLLERKPYDDKDLADEYRAYFGQIQDRRIHELMHTAPEELINLEVNFIPTTTVSQFRITPVPANGAQAYRVADDIQLIEVCVEARRS